MQFLFSLRLEAPGEARVRLWSLAGLRGCRHK